MSDIIILNDKEITKDQLKDIQQECEQNKDKKLIKLSENTYKVLIKLEE